MTITDRRDGLTQGVAVKRPVRVAATANLTLSGLQTIDGVALGAGDANLRVLAAGQADASENGIYNASSGVWERAKDFDGVHDIVKGTLIFVTDGAAYGGTVFRVDTADPIVGTTALSIVHYPTLLADDLLAVEALTGTGIVRRTGANAWSAGTAVATAEIADDAVTYAKVQNVATDRLLGRDAAGAGNIEELTVAGGLAFTGAGGVTLDIAGLAEDTAPDAAADFVVTRDASAGANRKVRIDNLLDALPGLVPLAANTTFYVRPDGNDANNGLTDSPAGAFLTWQGGWDKIRATYNFNGKTVTMQCGGTGIRTFTNGSGSILQIAGWVGGGALNILGDTGTPDNVRVTSTAADCFRLGATAGETIPGNVTIAGFTITADTNGYGINNQSTGHLDIGSAIVFSDVDGNAQLAATWKTATIHCGAYIVAGDCSRHIDADAGLIQLNPGSFTVSGSRTFSGVFARVRNHGTLICTNSWNVTGSVVGQRFLITENGFCNVETNGLTFFPGNSAGVAQTGGIYSGSVLLQGLVSATATEMEAALSALVPVTPSIQHRHPGHPKAWVKANGDGSGIDTDYGVSSVTDIGTGQLTVNWDVNFSSAEYCVLATLNSTSGRIAETGAPTVGSVLVQSYGVTGGAASDPGHYFVAAFGDQ
jgi:hypothetical protein